MSESGVKRSAAEMSASAASASSSSTSLPPEKKAHTTPKCPYGSKCYRKNPDHLRDYDHTDTIIVEADASKPHCPYGWQCYRVNPVHRAEQYHAPPPKVRPISPFPGPFEEAEYGGDADTCLVPRTLREIDMMRMMGAIKEKPLWYEKVHDATITEKWKVEAKAQCPRLTKASLNYLIEELKYQASVRDGNIQIAAIDGVWQADNLIDESVKQALINGVAPLENVPEERKDYHPGTNKQVLDLVHPSLYCYVIGQTRVTENEFGVNECLGMIGAGEKIGQLYVPPPPPVASAPGARRNRPPRNGDYSTSERFAWLPSDFSVSETGEVTIDSYINNLHPIDHHDLYEPLTKIFQRFVPMFEKVLTNLKNPTPLRINADCNNWYERPKGWKDEDAPEGDTAEAKVDGDVEMAAAEGKVDGAEAKEEGEDDEDEEDEDEDEDYENRPIYIPDVAHEFKPYQIAKERIITLGGRKLQVIVKLANIILTPEQPAYKGGSWHVEGMKNEAIVASGIYYFVSENITESRLAFRQACEEPGYEQSDDRGVREVYGLENEHALNQPLGSLITKADRCIAFPNIYQHQVQPFELIDKTKIGLRKILVFFLVDPTQSIISTARVPPQQMAWLKSAKTPFHQVFLNETPLIDPLIRIILEYTDLGVITQEQAEKQREELMEERKYFISQNNEKLFEREFSLCEH